MKLALAGINSPTVRTKALITLGYMLRGHPENRTIFEGRQFIFFLTLLFVSNHFAILSISLLCLFRLSDDFFRRGIE
jgi:hypothetical protein